MKKIILTIIGIIAFGTITVNAQKIGYCQLEDIVTIMPEYNQAQAKLEGEVADVQSQAEEMQVEFNNKYKAYTDNAALADGDANKWSPAIMQVKEQELSDLQQRIQDFQTTAQQTLQQRQMDLIQPISDKVDSVINVIMKDEGLSFVIKDLTIIDINKDKCVDVTPMIKQRLNLQ